MLIILIVHAGSNVEQIVKILLQNNADANIEMRDYFQGGETTPLIFAIQRSKINLVNLLIDNGANIDLTDFDGLNSLEWAKMMKSHFPRLRTREKSEIFNLLVLRSEKGFWKYFLSCYKMIYDGMKWIIPEKFLKVF